MNSEQYQAFTEQLAGRARDDEDVLGLVALGSMADLSRRDRWSDHDFFWVVRAGRQEHYRQILDWLPDADQIVLWFRETAHGLKVLFASGHLIEFAVFDLEEIHLARANDYAVIWDRGGVAEAMAEIVARSPSPPVDPVRELSFVLCLLQVGVGRHARGEEMSGHMFVKSYALDHLLRLLAAVVPAEREGQLDNLDPFRRFESVYPALGREIAEALVTATPGCAERFLDLIERELAGRVTPFSTDAVKALRQRFTASQTALVQGGGEQ